MEEVKVTARRGSGVWEGFGSGPLGGGYLGDNAQKLTADELIPSNLLDAISRIDFTGMTEEEIQEAVAEKLNNPDAIDKVEGSANVVRTDAADFNSNRFSSDNTVNLICCTTVMTNLYV